MEKEERENGGRKGKEKRNTPISEHIPHKRVQLTYPHILTWIKSFLLTRVGSAIRSWWRVSMSVWAAANIQSFSSGSIS